MNIESWRLEKKAFQGVRKKPWLRINISYSLEYFFPPQEIASFQTNFAIRTRVLMVGVWKFYCLLWNMLPPPPPLSPPPLPRPPRPLAPPRAAKMKGISVWLFVISLESQSRLDLRSTAQEIWLEFLPSKYVSLWKVTNLVSYIHIKGLNL